MSSSWLAKWARQCTQLYVLQYTMEKLKNVMQWREEEGAPTMSDLIALGNGPESAPEAVENPEGLTKAKDMST